MLNPSLERTDGGVVEGGAEKGVEDEQGDAEAMRVEVEMELAGLVGEAEEERERGRERRENQGVSG